jgi:hypothetical protein
LTLGQENNGATDSHCTGEVIFVVCAPTHGHLTFLRGTMCVSKHANIILIYVVLNCGKDCTVQVITSNVFIVANTGSNCQICDCEGNR